MEEERLKARLDEAAARINVPGFVALDPVQFPRRYHRLQDVEIAALLTATISWGRRPMILRDADRMLAPMGQSPYEYLMNGGVGEYNADGSNPNVHRTFFQSDLAYYLRGLHRIYQRHDDLNTFFRSGGAAHAWDVAAMLFEQFTEANGGRANPQCLPARHDTSALKRLNMALRWMVRRDGIVDLGRWDFIPPSQLFIPLDVHVARVARGLGILGRKSNDRRAVEQLTAVLRRLNPQDPTLYDFALFGLGVEQAG